MPGSEDSTAPGTINTATGELFGPDGAQWGILSYKRVVIGADAGLGGAVRSLVHAFYEFGVAQGTYFDDAISVEVVTKRDVAAGGATYADHDTAISGGSGKFLGAFGKISVRDADIQDGTLNVKRIFVRFDVFVPKVAGKMLP